jgi:methanethiol S-methyltransferase
MRNLNNVSDSMPQIVYRFLLFALIHSLLATEMVKRLLCRNRQQRTRYYRLLYNLLAAGSAVWLLAALPGSRELYALSGYPQLFLRLFQACALILLCRCAAQTGLSEFLGIRQLLIKEDEAPLFTREGCYALVRHPQYTLAIVFLVASPTMTVNHALFTLLSAGYFFLGGIIEETRLCGIFGGDYRRYQREVPMFLPTRFQ